MGVRIGYTSKGRKGEKEDTLNGGGMDGMKKGWLSWPVFLHHGSNGIFQSFHFGCAYRQGVNGWEGQKREGKHQFQTMLFFTSSFFLLLFVFDYLA